MSISLNSRRGFLVCSGARTGSSLLCDGLRQTRVAGDPLEHFNQEVQKSASFLKIIGSEAGEADSAPAIWFEKVLNACTTNNGMFGSKVHGGDLKYFIAGLARAGVKGSDGLSPNATGREILSLWGSFDLVRLRRENVVAQAISHHRAIASEVWYQPKALQVELTAKREPVYDYESIQKLVQFHIKETLIWDAFFLDFPRPILTLTYEQLSLDPAWITAQVLEHLGLDPSAADKVEVRSERQADDLSLEWEERFIKERRERGEEPSAGVGAPLRTEAGKVQPRGRQRRICLATKEVPGLFRNGGIGTAMGGLAEALGAGGGEVTLLYVADHGAEHQASPETFRSEQERYAEMGVTLRSLVMPAVSGNDARLVSLAVYRFLVGENFDHVVFAENSGLGFYSLEAKRTGAWSNPPEIVVVAHGPGQWVRQLNGTTLTGLPGVATDFLERRSVELADVLVSPSRYLLDWMSSAGWRMARDAKVIHNILPTVRKTNPAGLEPGRLEEIVFFGRQETRKGLALFCDAIDRVNAKGPFGDVRVTILGKFDEVDGAHSGIYLAERVRGWHFATRIISTYGQAEALAYLGRKGVLAVMPSLAENSPCVVAECIASGIAFLATDSGGTAELVDPEDRETCLFAPNAADLETALRRVLAVGQPRIRAAVPEGVTKAAWCDLLFAAPVALAPPASRPGLVSVCIAGYPTDAALASISNQVGITVEVVVVDTSDLAADHTGTVGAHTLRVFAHPGAALAEARNTAASLAEGKALVFAAPTDEWADIDGVMKLWLAHQRARTDIVTSLTAGNPEEPALMPIGACASLSTIENCIGETPFIVSTEWFRKHDGFSEADPAVLDWIYLAGATHGGATLSVLPANLTSNAPRWRGQADQKAIGQAVKMIARSLAATTGSDLSDTLELLMRMHPGALPRTQPHPDVSGLVRWPANGSQAEQSFVEYCLAQGLVDVAIDYAMMNAVGSIASVVDRAGRTLSKTALRWISPGRVRLSHRLDLTDALRLAMGGRPGDPLLLQPAAPQLGIARLRNACPPGLLGLEARASVALDSSGRPRYAIAVAAENAAPQSLDPAEEGRTWSGWIDASDTTATARLGFLEAQEEPMDLLLLTEQAEDTSEVHIVWTSVQAELEGVGASSLTAFNRRFRVRAVAQSSLLEAELVSDIGSFPHQVLVGGPPLQTHPIPGTNVLIRLPNLVHAGGKGLSCRVSLDHPSALAVDFNLYLAPSSEPLAYPSTIADLANAVTSSGWITVNEAGVKREIVVVLGRATDAALDAYLAVRPTDGRRVDFALATWQEFLVLS